MRFYTYLHTRLSDGQVFYVGKGTARRAWSTCRSAHWKSVVAKHGLRVDVLSRFDTTSEALLHEVFLISCFRDLRAPLVNKTDGGEGVSGHRHSVEVCSAMSAARKGSANPRYGRPGTMLGKKMPQGFSEKIKKVNEGKVLSAETRAKISAANKGHSRNKKGAPRTLSPEAIERMRQGAKNMQRPTLSPEGRARIAEAKRAYWAARKEQ